LYQEDRLIPIGLFPKLSGDVIPDWPTPTGQRTTPTGLRRLTFGVPFAADSTKFKKYGEGNMYLTAKSAPGASGRNNNRLPEDDFARTVWSYEAGMLFRLDDELLKQASSKKGLAFAKEANPTDGSGCLMLLALRTFKYDLATGEQCSYTAIDNALPVIMAYVTTARDVKAYVKCKKNGTDIEGLEGPIIYEIPFRKLSFPPDYEFLGRDTEGDIYPKEIVHDTLTRLVECESCGAPACLDIASPQTKDLRCSPSAVKGLCWIS
jgi:hypothetical protein